MVSRRRRHRRIETAPGAEMAPGAATGLTLIEMLVSVGILSMMILAFGTILSQSQRLVSCAQARIRANAAATAIEQVIRSDLRQVSQNGFLCIDTRGQSSQLFLTAAGTAPSITGGPTATGSFVGYGLCGGDILWRSAWVLSRDAGGGDHPDVWRQDLSEILKMDPPEVNKLIDDLNDQSVPTELPNPPTTLEHLKELWQYLSANCESLDIRWTDGESDASGLQWYGRGNPKGDNKIERFSTGDSYRALWTHHPETQTMWPKAILFRFSLRDPALPLEMQEVDYEIICNIAQ